MAFRIPYVFGFIINYAGITNKSYENMTTKLFVTLDTANYDTGIIRGLNLVAVKLTTFPMSNRRYVVPKAPSAVP